MAFFDRRLRAKKRNGIVGCPPRLSGYALLGVAISQPKKSFFLCPATFRYEIKRADNSRHIRLAGYWLCVYASGSVITVILSLSALIRVSLLHLGQNSGKFISTVSLRSIVRVLPLQMGQDIKHEGPSELFI